MKRTNNSTSFIVYSGKTLVFIKIDDIAEIYTYDNGIIIHRFARNNKDLRFPFTINYNKLVYNINTLTDFIEFTHKLDL